MADLLRSMELNRIGTSGVPLLAARESSCGKKWSQHNFNTTEGSVCLVSLNLCFEYRPSDQCT